VVAGELLVLINQVCMFCSSLPMGADGGVEIDIIQFVNGIRNGQHEL